MIKVDVAGLAHKPDIEHMLQDYLAELAPMTGEQPDHQGQFAYPYLDFYWQVADRTPLHLTTGSQTAGFSMVREMIDPSNAEHYRELAEFYILPKHRRTGLGRQAALTIWNRWPGLWCLNVLRGNLTAKHFWAASIKKAKATNLVRSEDSRYFNYQFRI